MAMVANCVFPPAVVPYQEPRAKGDSTELSSTLSSTLPMAAMLTRNKFIGWYARTSPTLARKLLLHPLQFRRAAAHSAVVL